MVNRTRGNGCTTIDVKVVCRNIGSDRPCFEFRVTSVQNHRGSGHRLKRGIFDDRFLASLLLSVGNPLP